MHYTKPRFKDLFFKLGTEARAKRDVLAKELARHPEIKTPYALATSAVERGANVRPKSAVAKELKAQKKEKRGKRVTRRDQIAKQNAALKFARLRASHEDKKK